MTGGSRKPFNTYRIEGDVAFMQLTNRAGEVVAEALLDVSDLKRLEALGVRWSRCPVSKSKTYVAARIDGTTTYLHRHLMDTPSGYDTDHLNRDTLDNRRSNLRIATRQENQVNRGAAVNSSTGIRNVSLSKTNPRRPFRVRLGNGHGKAHIDWCCRTLNIAAITAELARLQYWGKEAV